MNVCVLLGINCGDPGVPMNGVVSTNGTYVTSVAEFTCDDGYMRVGDAQRVCQPDGTWSNMVPDCLRKLLFILIGLFTLHFYDFSCGLWITWNSYEWKCYYYKHNFWDHYNVFV